MAGAILASSMLKVLADQEMADLYKPFIINGFPILDEKIWSWYKQLIFEFFGSFFLILVFYMTEIDPKNKSETPVVNGPSIGGVYGFMLMAMPKGSATSMNPARALGPMLVSPMDAPWTISWIYIVGPIAGAGFGALLGEWFINQPRKYFFMAKNFKTFFRGKVRKKKTRNGIRSNL
jgi:glycerol uptake facilitator-like aquaporin